MKTKDAILLVGVVIVGFIVANQANLFAAPGPGADEDEGVRQGTSSTLSVAAFDRTADSSTQIGSDSIYAWKDNGDRVYLGSKSASSSSRNDFTNLVVGDSADAVAFGSTYDYGVMKSKEIDTEQELLNLDVWQGISSGSVSTTVYDESDSSSGGSVSIGSGETYSLAKMTIKTSADNRAYNPRIIAFEYSGNSDSNVSSISMTDATDVSCPDSLDSAMSSTPDDCFLIFSESKEPLMSEWETLETGSIQIEADSDGTSGETLEYAINDYAPYINTDDELAYGIEDDTSSPSDVGVGIVTGSLTLN